MNTSLLLRPEHTTDAAEGLFDIEQMYLQYHDRLYRYLVHLVSDRDQAEILASPPYLVGIEGAGPRPMLCDLMQQVRALRLSPHTNRKEKPYA